MSDQEPAVPPAGASLPFPTQQTASSTPTPTQGGRGGSPPGTLDTTLSIAGTVRKGSDAGERTPPQSPSGAGATAAPGFTPMRRGRVHGLDDSPRNRQMEAERWARAQAEMVEKGRIVDDMRNGKFRAPAPRKNVAGGDAVRESGIPVWTGGTRSLSRERAARLPEDPFEHARAQCARVLAATSAKRAQNNAPSGPGDLRPLWMGPRQPTGDKGKQKAAQRRASPPPTAGPSAPPPASTRSARSEPWRPLTQYLPHQLEGDSSSDERNFPRMERRPATAPRAHPEPAGRVRARRESLARPPSPLARKSDEAEARREAAEIERLNEEAAHRIQAQLWEEERAYNRTRRSLSQGGFDDPMDEDDFELDDDEDVLAPDSQDDRDGAAAYDSFDDASDIESPGDEGEKPALINIEPAVGDDRAKAAARSSIFAETKARIRWSPVTCEPIAGMTQAKLVAGIDPAQLRQHVNGTKRLDDAYIGFVHAVGGTRSADINRVTLITALDTMISLTCRAGTKVLFSAARQDPNGPRLRPGTVLIDTPDDDLGALWQESAHWAQAGVRFTVQKYHQPHSAFMVTLEGTRRNRLTVAHGVRAAARKLPQLKSVFRQYNALHPGLGRAARDNLVKSVTARPLALTARKALGFGTVQYNIYAQLNERATDAEPRLLTGDPEVDGYPPLSAEMHWAVRDAFQQITIVDGRLGDATPIEVPWDCTHCFAESHPVGKCDLKDIEGWFKSYDEFLAANTPQARDRGTVGKPDKKGKAKAPPPRTTRAGGPSKGGSSKSAPPRAGPSRGPPR